MNTEDLSIKFVQTRTCQQLLMEFPQGKFLELITPYMTYTSKSTCNYASVNIIKCQVDLPPKHNIIYFLVSDLLWITLCSAYLVTSKQPLTSKSSRSQQNIHRAFTPEI
ncbi:hypothetical protein KUTeg_010090 [Tegillarca granosa]|uniref:Uncharacterized protein n=1 Tax=Tegillarca granosa TaxID=220873 RepID=A0ABQ9FA57_TEGGR|nr:hypothetical protein KUTeg_010090 [Tegillarca granosa]